ncbi:ABC transporter ATP-binding protein [Paenibacillus sp. CF384]|uniref:ABC transporter ATP-binding protein n=1 Tax=Paenibacillus sp. CF384 TaxID=1884382 RepID=UPI000896AA00|nr:ABC transporter ATP-binding protein [Paenibacillus sp. CF384]SDX78635.1 nucleoside ABC transporter ATP-binding protein [Paenibacillus sp. CF384]
MQESFSVEMRGIVKRFESVIACDEVNFRASAGEVHALLGENGAGKSTLMCMLSGVYQPTGGAIYLRGEQVKIRSPKDALKQGIGMVFQSFRLVPTLTAAENIVLGEPSSIWRGTGWMKKKQEEIEAIATKFGLAIHVDRPIWQLSVGEQQRVEIMKTLYRGADIIVLDEPTSVLTPGEAELLFQTLEAMKKEGKTVIMTTHKLGEVMQASDRISVMRKGKMVVTMETGETNERDLAKLMVGKAIIEMPHHSAMNARGELLLSAQELEVIADHGRVACKDLSLHVHHGEIVGIAGVAGNGQKELAEVLTGLRHPTRGSIRMAGKDMRSASVRDFIEAGIAHIPENRMRSGLAGSLGAADNLLLKSYRSGKRTSLGFLRMKRNMAWSQQLIEQFDVRMPSVDTPVSRLSGGNQQKLLFAREIHQSPKLMIAVHPTQGLDIGAASSVHRLLFQLRNSGGGVLLISEDLDEVLRLSDRILVISRGGIVGEMKREEATREQIGLYMAGVRDESGEGEEVI